MRSNISVVIPAYNAELTIKRCLKSVLEQAVKCHEVIVIDDGSVDRTSALAEEYSPRVRVIQQTNSGAAVARQVGTEAATGAYVAYLDSDDQWLPGTAEKFHKIIESEKINFLFCDFYRRRGDEILPPNSSAYPWAIERITRTGSRCSMPSLYTLNKIEGLNLLFDGFPAFPSTYLVCRRAALSVGWDGRFDRNEELDFALRMANSSSIHYLHELVAVYYLHGTNDDQVKYILLQAAAGAKVLERHMLESNDLPYRKLAKAALAKKQLKLAGAQFRSGLTGQAIASVTRATLNGARLSSVGRLFISQALRKL